MQWNGVAQQIWISCNNKRCMTLAKNFRLQLFMGLLTHGNSWPFLILIQHVQQSLWRNCRAHWKNSETEVGAIAFDLGNKTFFCSLSWDYINISTGSRHLVVSRGRFLCFLILHTCQNCVVTAFHMKDSLCLLINLSLSQDRTSSVWLRETVLNSKWHSRWHRCIMGVKEMDINWSS